MTLSVIAKEAGAVHSRPPLHHGPDGSVMDMSGMIDSQVVATHTFETAPPLDILMVPGGIGDLTLAEHKDRTIEDFIVSRFNTTEYVLSVCSSDGFLARAGVLEGRRDGYDGRFFEAHLRRPGGQKFGQQCRVPAAC